MAKVPIIFQNFTAKCFGSLNYLDRQVTSNLHVADIETRPANSNGLWCCALLPAVLMFYNVLYQVSPVYSLVAYISLGLLFYCTLFIIFLSVSHLVMKESVYGGCIVPSVISALLLYIFIKQDLTFSLLFSIPTIYLYSLLLRASITRFPKTFTIGEAMIVTQSILLYGVMIVGRLISNVHNADEDIDLIHGVVNTVLSTVGLIVTALCVMTDKERNLKNLLYVIGGAAIYALLTLHLVLGVDGLLKVIRYIFFYGIRAKLVTFWLFLLVIALLLLSVRTKLAVKASTVTRKSFHVLASVVFLTGIVWDRHLITLGAGIGLGLIVLVEALRKSGIEPISSALLSAFLVYSDEKDCGTFAMTPLYMYCGLACPLLLVPRAHAEALELLSGVLAVGVGDTAASWFGSRYGFNKWTDSNKSMEGTAFNILSQLSAVYALQFFKLINSHNALIRTAVAATISGLVEARTEQVDNLVLPLVTLISYQLTWFLC